MTFLASSLSYRGLRIADSVERSAMAMRGTGGGGGVVESSSRAMKVVC